MKANNLLIICLGVTTSLFGVTTALECYQCQTITDGPGCGDKDGFDTNMPVSSKPGSDLPDLGLGLGLLGNVLSDECAYCTKAKAKQNGEEYVMRSCISISAGQEVDDCSEWSYEGNKGEICLCDKDKCNSGTLYAVSLPLLVLTVLATLIKALVK